MIWSVLINKWACNILKIEYFQLSQLIVVGLSIAPSLFRARRYNLYHRAHHGLTKCFIQKLNRQNKFIILYLQVKVNPITTKSLNYA